MTGPNCHLLIRPFTRGLLHQNALSLTRPQPLASIGATSRSITTSQACFGRNFRKFYIPNRRGIFEYPKNPGPFFEKEYRDRILERDTMKVTYPGFWINNPYEPEEAGQKFVYVKEMEPELIVPDIDDCPLKPYVSYRTEDITQSQFTAEQLFNVTYGSEILAKYRRKEQIPDSYFEFDEAAQTEAKNRALSIGADVFSHTSYFGSLDGWRFGHEFDDE